ncbi:MAG: AAA domain-containing protein [Clostridia bacterium]|nr:AAA domain-containing protein [Clostridia bacterium]
MDLAVTVDQKQLMDVLLNVGMVRPVFIWGAPGIGKSAIVEQFAMELNLECVSLLGSQLAPEDIIGVPQIVDGRSVFCPPREIAREEPYCLFLDELNVCSHEVQKAFYSLILERRIGEYRLPEGSIVIGAGNRAQDSAITRPMSSALVNRMFHVELTANTRIWLEWAARSGIHRYVYDYLSMRPDHLWSQPPKTEEPFSTPRSWHMLSDAITSYGDNIGETELTVLANGCLTPAHAAQFIAYLRQVRSQFSLNRIMSGEAGWPNRPEERDILYFLAQSFRAQLLKELPPNRKNLTGSTAQMAMRAKSLLADLANISLEIAQVAVTPDDGSTLPAWFVIEAARDIPGLAGRKWGES